MFCIHCGQALEEITLSDGTQVWAHVVRFVECRAKDSSGQMELPGIQPEQITIAEIYGWKKYDS